MVDVIITYIFFSCNMNNPLFDINTYDDDISYNEMFEEVLYLRERVSQLEVSNSNLKLSLDETNLLKLQLENTILTQSKQSESNPSGTKRKYKRKELSKEMQMFNSYYKENKNNEEIITAIKTKMNEIGYVINNKKDLPAQLVRMECYKRYSQINKNDDISNKNDL